MNYPIGKKLIADAFTLNVRDNDMVFDKPLNGGVDVGSRPGDHWIGSLTWTNRSGDDADTIRMFLQQTRRGNIFSLYPHDRTKPKGTALGTPVVAEAGAAGYTIQSSGWDANQTEVLKPGDYIQIGTELKQIVTTASSNATGNAQLEFVPSIKTPPADGSQIITDYPRGFFIRTDSQPDTSVGGGFIYAMSLSFREYF